MKKLVAAIFIFILMTPQLPGATAKGFDTGKYSATEWLELKKQENAKDIPRLNEIFAKADRYAFSDEVTPDEIVLMRVYDAPDPIFQAYGEKGSFASLIDYSEYFYYFEINQLSVSQRGSVHPFDSYGRELFYNSSTEFPDEATVIEIIDRDIGRVNDILLFHMGMESTYYDALLFSVTTDQNRYLIPYKVDTHFCHLENGKVYTEARAMEIMGTFLEDDDYEYQGETFYPGPSDMKKKKPTDEQIAALGLTDIEQYRSSAWPAAVSSTPAASSSASSEQQPSSSSVEESSSSEKKGTGDQTDNTLWLLLTGTAAAGIAVAVFLRVRRNKVGK